MLGGKIEIRMGSRTLETVPVGPTSHNTRISLHKTLSHSKVDRVNDPKIAQNVVQEEQK